MPELINSCNRSSGVSDKEQFRVVNKILGSQPSVGPIPADQVLPWSCFMAFSIMVGRVLLPMVGLDIGWFWTILMGAWLCATWWVLTGRRSWRFLGKFQKRPNWTIGYHPYKSLF